MDEVVIRNETIKKPGSAAKPFECTICPKSFVYKKSLEEHILNQHVADKEFQCTKCFETKQITKYFASQPILSKHIKRVHSLGLPCIKCQICFKTFNNSMNFKRHKQTHSITNIKRHKCELCSKAFTFDYKLKTHLLSVHNQKREDSIYYKCELCSQEFSSRCELEKHVVKKHVVDKAFECLVCSKKFIDEKTLEKHIKCHDRQNEYFCDICNKGFRQKRSLVKHLGVTHNHFFYCDKKCLRSFKNKQDFDAHISDDARQELNCYICQETMDSECNLKIHTDCHVKEIKTEKKEIQVENRIEPLETNELIKEVESTKDLNLKKSTCPLCYKTFDRQAYFTAHRREVHPNAEWKCNFEQCSKSFKWYNQLKLHKMMHSDTKQFACNICQKAFHRPDSLKDHEQIHVADKKYKCEMCPKSFVTSVSLRAHVANNHGGPKPFKCPFINCGTSWVTSANLNIHLISHQTDRSFKCEICTKCITFKNLPQLKQHHRDVHFQYKKKLGQRKHCDAVVFICSCHSCSFETVSETQVALHYNQQHQLPKVLILKHIAPPGVSKESQEKFKAQRIIQTRYKCEICSKLFKSASSFSGHRLTHSDKSSFKCSFCSKSFKCKRYLNNHIKIMMHQKRKRS